MSPANAQVLTCKTSRSGVVDARATLRHTLLTCGVLLLILLAAMVLTSLLGSEPLPARAAMCALFSLGNSTCGLTPEQSAILLEIRSPRILLAAAVGASLAAAGASYQALLRNPLAEPYLLGISNGAAVGTMFALVFFGAFEWSRPLMAFAGALSATVIVYRLGQGRAGATPERLILAGVIVTTFLSSAIVFVTTLMDATRIRSFTFWLLGDLSGATTTLLLVALVVAVGATLLLTANARSLNLLMLGERDAFGLGVEVVRVRLVVFVARVYWLEVRWRQWFSRYVGLGVRIWSTFMAATTASPFPLPLGRRAFRCRSGSVARTIIAPRNYLSEQSRR